MCSFAVIVAVIVAVFVDQLLTACEEDSQPSTALRIGGWFNDGISDFEPTVQCLLFQKLT